MKLALLALATATSVTALFLTPLGQATEGAGKPRASKSRWLARYVTGSVGWQKHEWIAVEFSNGSEERKADPDLVVLPASRIVQVGFSQQGVNDSDRIQSPRSGCGYAGAMMPDALQSLPDAILMRRVDPGLGSRVSMDLMLKHPVRIVWKTDDSEKSVTLSVNDCEYESLVANLRRMLGSRWPSISKGDFSLKASPNSK